MPDRSSRMRVGASNGWNRLPVVGSYHPTTSAIRSVEPFEVANETLPSCPTFTVVRFAIVWPAATLRVDAVGRGCPVGHAVRNVLAFDCVLVRLNTTAVALAGMPLVPATVSARGDPST